MVAIMDPQSRPTSPELLPEEEFDENGALVGDLPLVLPRRSSMSCRVAITNRQYGITVFTVTRKCDSLMALCRIDTYNEWILLTGIGLFTGSNGELRLNAGHVPLSRIVANAFPSNDPERIFVDHADTDTLDDTESNLHWVTPTFNAFNRLREPGESGFYGVLKLPSARGNHKYRLTFRNVVHGNYSNAGTAARVYDILCRLTFEDQLDKTPHLLNDLDSTPTAPVFSQGDGVAIWHIDDIFVNIFDLRASCPYNTFGEAQREAQALCARLREEQARKEAEWEKNARDLVPEYNKEGKAFFAVKSKEQEGKDYVMVEVLLDEKKGLDSGARNGVHYQHPERSAYNSFREPTLPPQQMAFFAPSSLANCRSQGP